MAYTKSTIRRAEKILGYGITTKNGPRTFTTIDGVLYTDVFDSSNDVEITDYSGEFYLAFNGKRNGVDYYNEIHFTSKCPREVTLNLVWGSTCFTQEIDGLLAWLEENPSTEKLDLAGTKSLKIEDFSQSQGTAEETQADINTILHEGFGYYIRRPFVLDVASEQRHDWRHF